MKNNPIKRLLRSIFLGKRYAELTDIKEQVRYMTMNSIFMVAIIPLSILGITMINVDIVRTIMNFAIAFLCMVSLVLIRSKMPLRYVPFIPVSVFGAFCCYLLYLGDLNLWAAIWIFAFPPIVIFLCQITIGLIETILVLAVTLLLMYSPFSQISPANEISIRFVGAYILIASLSVIYEWISILKDRKEAELKGELGNERDMIQTMKDNIQQGIFLMDKELRILPQYSQPLIPILSFYESDLAGKNFLDILSGSLDSKQLQFMKSYFSMVFDKTKSVKVLESANPISEFEYKTDDDLKILSTRFSLIEQAHSEPVIIGIVQDVTREKEFEHELQAQKEAQELEMKNMFDVFQVDPLVFQDFIEDTESNFNYINSLLKDKTLSEKQVVIKLFQNIHAIKSNATILGLEHLGNKIHFLEDTIKAVSNKEKVTVDDILSLALRIEALMQEMDSYTAITRKINAYKVSNQIDTILINSMTKAVDRLSTETQKKVEIKAGQIDMNILETKLRKPIKDILFQCVRNSIYHGIEPVQERVNKNKKPVGLLVFSIKNVDGKAEITFSDDGSGLDWVKIRKKYLEKHPGEQTVDKKTLLGVIFQPEFSTADNTTLTAGRGVGLSLVMDLVKENNGAININSTESGLTLKFIFPLPK